MPPMSAWCARVATKAMGVSWPAKTGATVVMSGRCVPPRNGSFSASTSPGLNGASSITSRTAAGIAPRCTGMCAACATISPGRVEHRARVIAPLLDVRRVRGVPSASPISSAMEVSAASAIARSEAESVIRRLVAPPVRSSSRFPCASASATHPGSTRVVVSSCVTIAGPSMRSPGTSPRVRTRACRVPRPRTTSRARAPARAAGPKSGTGASVSDRTRATARTFTTSTGAEGRRARSAARARRGRPPRRHRGVRVGDRDGEFVRLPGVAHIERVLDLGVRVVERVVPPRPPRAGHRESWRTPRLQRQQHGAGARGGEVALHRAERASTPGIAGTSTRGISSASASAQACSGPAPPNATSVNSRGSKPRCTETTRSARSMFAVATAAPPRGGAFIREGRSSDGGGRPRARATSSASSRRAGRARPAVRGPPARR
jgi:hypothetical protein